MEKVSVAAVIAANEEQGGTEEEKARRLARLLHMANQDTYHNLLKWYGEMVRMAMHYKGLWAEAYREKNDGILPAVKQEAHYKRMWECRKAEAEEALRRIRSHRRNEELEEETAKFIILSAERMMRELDDANNIQEQG